MADVQKKLENAVRKVAKAVGLEGSHLELASVLPDGEYTLEDGRKFIILEGDVVEVMDAEGTPEDREGSDDMATPELSKIGDIETALSKVMGPVVKKVESLEVKLSKSLEENKELSEKLKAAEADREALKVQLTATPALGDEPQQRQAKQLNALTPNMTYLERVMAQTFNEA